MSLINNYISARKAIYDHVGLIEDWVINPIDDCTDKYWTVNKDSVTYADDKDDVINGSGNCYTDEIHKQRFYDKWVYEGKDITLIFCDPHVDGCRWFRIFDNSKRIK